MISSQVASFSKKIAAETRPGQARCLLFNRKSSVGSRSECEYKNFDRVGTDC